jgi:hypothetical protein
LMVDATFHWWNGIYNFLLWQSTMGQVKVTCNFPTLLVLFLLQPCSRQHAAVVRP